MALSNLTGVLLAGGQSKRMGTDKRFLALEGISLFERSLAVLEDIFQEILVVYGQDVPNLRTGKARVCTDIFPKCAAAGGLFTALSYASNERVFLAACDMPFLDRKVITFLAAQDPNADVIVAKIQWQLQMTHAIYSKRCLPILKRMLDARNYRLQELCEQPSLSILCVTEERIATVDPHFLSFLNLNTPRDLERAQKIMPPST